MKKSGRKKTHSADRFGERAVKAGFCTAKDVEKAVAFQQDLARRGLPHKLIGLVLLESGAISTEQLIRVLKTYEDADAPVE